MELGKPQLPWFGGVRMKYGPQNKARRLAKRIATWKPNLVSSDGERRDGGSDWSHGCIMNPCPTKNWGAKELKSGVTKQNHGFKWISLI